MRANLTSPLRNATEETGKAAYKGSLNLGWKGYFAFTRKCTDGLLRIALDRAGEEVATVDLRAIVPHTVTEAPTGKRKPTEPRRPGMSIKAFRRSVDSKRVAEHLAIVRWTGTDVIGGTTLCISSCLSLSPDPADRALQDFVIGYEQESEKEATER